MSKKPEEKEEPPICRDPSFAPVLAHATQMLEHIFSEVDENTIEESHVTLGCDFVVDALSLLVEYASRYEPEFEEIYDDLVLQYDMMQKTKSGFGTKTRH